MIGPLNYIQIGAGVALGVLLASGSVYLHGKSEGRQEVAVERLQRTSKQGAKGSIAMRKYKTSVITTFVFSLFVLAGSGSMTASSCAGFRKANLNAAATVAVIQLDRPGAERIEGNDQNGTRRGCWWIAAASNNDLYRAIGILTATVEGLRRDIDASERRAGAENRQTDGKRAIVHRRMDELIGEVGSIETDIATIKDDVTDAKAVTDDVKKWKLVEIGALSVVRIG